MVIDFHVHIFSEKIRNNRTDYFPDEPEFRLLYESPKSRIVGAKETVSMMDEHGVDKSVVFGFPWKKAEIFKRENDYILNAVAGFPQRLIGFCCFDALNPEAPKEAERCLDAGLKGVGELAFYKNGIDEKVLDALDPIMEVCRKKNALLLIHTNEPVGHIYPGKSPNTLVQIYNLIKRFPNNKIILAHWGGGIFFYSLLKKEVKQSLENIWFDTAASPFLYDPDIYDMASYLGLNGKVLLGTDYPLLLPARYFKEMEKSGISDGEKDNILGKNALKLLNL